MVEFGEQLRKAREEKGMTQQTLAEQLYVTRQAVSRWECGDRYPDLLTTKKISTILEVSLDDLLSENEMNKIAERNPVIEKPVMNNIMIALYGAIVFSFAVTVADIVIRIPWQSEKADYGAIQMIALNLSGLLLQIGVFVFGLPNAIKGTLTPKRMGMVNALFFAAICLTDFNRINASVTWQQILMAGLIIVPGVAAAVAAFLYFIKGKNECRYRILLYLGCGWGILRMLLYHHSMIQSHGLSMNAAVGLLLKICIYVLITYQTCVLWKKRKKAELARD